MVHHTYKASRIEVDKAEDGRNRRIRNRMYGGEGGRRARALLLPDWMGTETGTIKVGYKFNLMISC